MWFDKYLWLLWCLCVIIRLEAKLGRFTSILLTFLLPSPSHFCHCPVTAVLSLNQGKEKWQRWYLFPFVFSAPRHRLLECDDIWFGVGRSSLLWEQVKNCRDTTHTDMHTVCIFCCQKIDCQWWREWWKPQVKAAVVRRWMHPPPTPPALPHPGPVWTDMSGCQGIYSSTSWFPVRTLRPVSINSAWNKCHCRWKDVYDTHIHTLMHPPTHAHTHTHLHAQIRMADCSTPTLKTIEKIIMNILWEKCSKSSGSGVLEASPDSKKSR